MNHWDDSAADTQHDATTCLEKSSALNGMDLAPLVVNEA